MGNGSAAVRMYKRLEAERCTVPAERQPWGPARAGESGRTRRRSALHAHNRTLYRGMKGESTGDPMAAYVMMLRPSGRSSASGRSRVTAGRGEGAEMRLCGREPAPKRQPAV